MTDIQYSVDDALKDRIRDRIGRPDATIEIREEHTNLGFCETCDYPVDGFSVYADDDLVWPSRSYLSDFGGITFMDEFGGVRGGRLTVFGQFDAWLNNRPWDEE